MGMGIYKKDHVIIEYVSTPKDLYTQDKYITLAVVVVFVNGIPFLIVSRGINLMTIEHMPWRTASHRANRAGFTMKKFLVT